MLQKILRCFYNGNFLIIDKLLQILTFPLGNVLSSAPCETFDVRIYDMDNDGFVSNGELFQVLKMMVGNNLKDTQLQQIVDKTILMYDKVSGSKSARGRDNLNIFRKIRTRSTSRSSAM